jgi:tripartite-type tricarboxylate transporter receptor subunit TctC
MMNRRKVLGSLAAFAAAPTPSKGQQLWAPSGPVKIVVPFAAGGPFDLYARTIGDRLSRRIGQPVILDFRPGAGQAIGADIVHRSPADGRTLFLMAMTFLLNSLITKVPFDPLKDFMPVIELGRNDIFVIANAEKLKFRTPADFLAWAEQNKSAALYGVPNANGGGQIVGDLINKRAGVALRPVVYKGAAPMVTDLIGGQIGLILDPFASVKPYIETGKIAVVANCSLNRSSFLPEVPTLNETVLPGFDLPAWYGFLAPPNTPEPIISRYNAEIGEIIREPAVVEVFNQFALTLTGGSSTSFARFMADTYSLYGELVRNSRNQVQ